MAGPGEPPEGTPEGVPGGGEDEYRSVVFDESFVRAARLQEFSAQERLDDHAPAVRSRRPWSRARGSRQALVLVILIALAFATAIYMGVRHPYQQQALRAAEPLRSSVIPLAPQGRVPGGAPADLFERSPAATYRSGAEGVTLPAARATRSFSESQVLAALESAKEYVVRSALDPDVLTGGAVRSVRVLLDPGQLGQFDRSLERPSDDGRHAATGWLIRFDPAQVALADPKIRVHGSLDVSESGPDQLEVTGDHTIVYAVRAAPSGSDASDEASLFTVRREVRLRFDRDDLRDHRVEVVQSYLQAGPLACAADPAGQLRPLLAGQSAKADSPAGTDPYAPGRPTAAVCGVLAPRAPSAPQSP
ncbi:SCO2583 family membrane protein [Streptomyces sp. 7N604]|uniref:SCO2583 family membrane protein n=1 Tax=Streptomyces sp. 7N604 TaxID=3457415 RepID=UPI003FD40F70